MTKLKLNNRQAALILEVTDDGEIKVEVTSHKVEDGDNELAVSICQEIATKLVNDEQFQESILAPFYVDEGDDAGDKP